MILDPRRPFTKFSLAMLEVRLAGVVAVVVVVVVLWL